MPYRVRPEAYGEALSEVYDRMYGEIDTPAAVDFLLALAGAGGRVVELGAGTGRLAVPLAEKGLRVQAVEVSEHMLAKLRERDPGGLVDTVRADFTEHVPGEDVDLCFIACNTLFMVPERERQIETLRKAGEVLGPDGTLVVEVYDPSEFHQLTKPELQARHLAPDELMLDTVTVDRVNQVLVEIHTLIRGGSVSTYTELSRYAWPSELDLMARLAGLSIVDRFADWTRSPFTPAAHRHITLYRKAG